MYFRIRPKGESKILVVEFPEDFGQGGFLELRLHFPAPFNERS